MAVRLVRYLPGRAVGDLLGEAVISTRQNYLSLLFHQDRTAGLLLRQFLQNGRLPSATPAVDERSTKDGRCALLIGAARWFHGLVSSVVFTDQWCIGIADAPIEAALTPHQFRIAWMRNPPRHSYYADPFLWPGTDRILCEEFLFRTQTGRLITLREQEPGKMTLGQILLDPGHHLSYPFTFEDGGQVYVIPETGDTRETKLYQLHPDCTLLPISVINRGDRFVDATLFRSNGLYWIAYTNLDIGDNDNLCFAYATRLNGRWRPHARNPVKIDIRSSRGGGTPFWHDGTLYRPAQDCSGTYGGAIVINRVLTLTTTAFREIPVARLVPDPLGPFPHGVHTITAAGHRTLVDGKRRIIRPIVSARKILRSACRLAMIGRK